MKIKVDKYDVIFSCVLLIATLLISYLFIFPSPEGESRKATELAESGKIAAAVEKYKRIVRTYPENYSAHVKLGKLYIQVNEPDMAKVEFYRAMKLNPKDVYDADFALADLYLDRGETVLAEDLVNNIKTEGNKKIYGQKGEFYAKLTKTTMASNSNDASRKLKLAYKCYERAELMEQKEVNGTLTEVAAGLADELAEKGKVNQALDLMDFVLTYGKNSKIYLKTGQLHEAENNTLKAVESYKSAYQSNKNDETKTAYYNILMKAGQEQKAANNTVKAKYFYILAKQLNPDTKIPFNKEGKLIINIVSTNFTENGDGEHIYPGISFRIGNIDKNSLNYLKARVVFGYKSKILGESEKIIADKDNPLAADGYSSIIKIFSPNTIEKYNDDKNVVIKIYASVDSPDKWVLYRTADMK